MKLQPLLALGLTLLAASTQAFGGATLDRIEKNKELVGVLMESYPPFSFLNEQNQLDGFDVDVAKAVAQKLGVKLRLETPSWDVIAAGRWSGRYDICICSMTPSKARAEVFDFPVEYYASPAVIVVNAKDDRIHSAKDLSGKKVGLTSASSYESYLNKNLVIEGAEDTQLQYPFEDVQIAPYDTDNVAFQDLGLGAGVRLDAILTNLVTAQPRLTQLGQAKVDQEDLDQQRRTAKERRVKAGNAKGHGAFGQAPQRGDKAQYRRGHDCAQAQEHCQRCALQKTVRRQVQAHQVGQFVENDRELQVKAQEKTRKQAKQRGPGQVQPRAETQQALKPRCIDRRLGRRWKCCHWLMSAPIHFCDSLLKVPSCFSCAKTSRTLLSHCGSPFSMATELGSEYSGSPASLKRLSWVRHGWSGITARATYGAGEGQLLHLRRTLTTPICKPKGRNTAFSDFRV
jgi:polar amino acid transport system substrate-binding protein